jgi:alkanesulfonate monooxygenase SsuD/methylene tetrahydromethanopterin reductase-like flavin-dependent oxidoreductase (luciferase family)
MIGGNNKNMLIGLTSGNGYGFQPEAWRTSGVDPSSYTSYDAHVKHVQAAERGKFQFIFLPDGPFTDSAPEHMELTLGYKIT